MSTTKIYDERPYDTDFVARVSEINENRIILDGTLFFPEEGGQTCDRGVIRCRGCQYNVIDVQIHDDVIEHTIDIPSGTFDITVGDEIEGHIDWAHRFDNMQNHTGEHIFSGLVHAHKGYDNVGFSLTGNSCQMDYNGRLSDEEIAGIEIEANEIIWESLPVECRYPSSDELAGMEYRSKKELSGPVRIVTIPGVDVCACCAPHVRTTSEVGLLKVISHINYKGGTRLYIACGKRAFDDYRDTFNALTDIGHLFSTGRPDALSAVQKMTDERQALRERLATIEKDSLFHSIDTAGGSAVFTKVTDRNVLTDAFTHYKEINDGACYIFSEKSDGEYTFLAGGKNIDARTLMPALKEKLDARGGGKNDMIQGSVKADKDKILEAIQ